MWLIDKSALVRVASSPDVDEWNNRIERGLVHITNLTRLEIGYSARTGAAARRDLREPPLAAMPVEYLTPAIEDRALEVQLLLADAGTHARSGCARDATSRAWRGAAGRNRNGACRRGNWCGSSR